MNKHEFRCDIVKEIIVHQEGDMLIIDGADFFPKDVDYDDRDHMRILATRAVHTADGFYDLVKNNCDTENPSL